MKNYKLYLLPITFNEYGLDASNNTEFNPTLLSPLMI